MQPNGIDFGDLNKRSPKSYSEINGTIFNTRQTKKMKNAVLYVRSNYHEEGDFPEVTRRAQKIRAKKFARRIEINIVRQFEEVVNYGDDFQRPVFCEMVNYLNENAGHIDILLLHYSDCFCVEGLDIRHSLLRILNPLNVIALSDEGENYIMTDEVYNALREDQNSQFDFVENFDRHIQMSDSRGKHGITVLFWDIEKCPSLKEITEYFDETGIIIEKTICCTDQSGSSFERISAELEKLDSTNGFTLVTNNDDHLNNAKATNELFGKLVPLGLKKVLVCKTSEVSKDIFVCTISPYIDDSSSDPERKIIYSLAS